MNILTSRQEKILELIVLEYVKTVNPVGSKHICDELNCSSATVRSEMSTLEDYGYLEKTHISSGRVPSEKGYRYYVDNLMKQEELNGNDMMNLQIIFNNNKLALTDCIKKSLEIISDITDYTTVVLGNKSSDNYLKKVEALPIEDNKMLTIVITDKGFVEHKKVDINNISLDEIQKTVELINKLLIGTPIDEVRKKLELEIKPIINKYVKQHEAIYNAFYDVFNDFTDVNNLDYFITRSNISYLNNLKAPRKETFLEDEVLIRRKTTVKYVLRMNWKETGINQNIDSGKTFKGKLYIETIK